MFKNKKLVVVMPAYNAEKTLIKTYNDVINQKIVDVVIIVDDASRDKTVSIAKTLKADSVKTILHIHKKNLGYGGNQKSCYRLALEQGGEIIILVHPDYQYTPQLIPAMVGMIVNKVYSCVLGSRVLGGGALKGGMPFWKFFINRCLTGFENFLLGAHLSEYHTGYRAFSKELLEDISLEHNSDGFIFDNEILAQILWKRYAIGEISCPTKYFSEASVITFWESIKYGFGCLRVAMSYRLSKMGLIKSKLFLERDEK
jgi:glycosyltransferase involved in cell wall biosynthesis